MYILANAKNSRLAATKLTDSADFDASHYVIRVRTTISIAFSIAILVAHISTFSVACHVASFHVCCFSLLICFLKWDNSFDV